MEKKANIALGLFISAFIIPTLFFAIAKAFSQLRPRQIEQLSFFIFLAFLFGAIICAIAAGKQKQAIGVLVASLVIFIAMILFSLVSVSAPESKMRAKKAMQIKSGDSKPISSEKSPAIHIESGNSKPSASEKLPEKKSEKKTKTKKDK